mmetsp:Transcript_73584/g.225058  ORF Transcript_73584/g.225058 Transcript_73584/m.225058 type:complete len:321 (+) Transcript_73584:1143-2105(+)
MAIVSATQKATKGTFQWSTVLNSPCRMHASNHRCFGGPSCSPASSKQSASRSKHPQLFKKHTRPRRAWRSKANKHTHGLRARRHRAPHRRSYTTMLAGKKETPATQTIPMTIAANTHMFRTLGSGEASVVSKEPQTTTAVNPVAEKVRRYAHAKQVVQCLDSGRPTRSRPRDRSHESTAKMDPLNPRPKAMKKLTAWYAPRGVPVTCTQSATAMTKDMRSWSIAHDDSKRLSKTHHKMPHVNSRAPPARAPSRRTKSLSCSSMVACENNMMLSLPPLSAVALRSSSWAFLNHPLRPKMKSALKALYSCSIAVSLRAALPT